MGEAGSSQLKDLGAAIREAREASGKTLRSALPGGNRFTHLSHIENGKSRPSMPIIDELRDNCDWPVETYNRIVELLTEAILEDRKLSGLRGRSLDDQRVVVEYQANAYLTPAELIRMGLERIHGTEDDITNLLFTVAGMRPALRNLVVDCELRDRSSQPDIYEMTMKQDFQAVIGEYVVAVVPDPSLTEAVISLCPRVADTWQLPPGKGLERAIETVNEQLFITVLDSKGGVTDHKDVKLDLVPEALKAEYLGELPQEWHEDITLLSGDLPPSDKALRRVVATATVELSKSGHYCFWVADRTIFVRKIAFDVSDFSFEGREPQFSLHPFMASIGPSNTRRHPGRFELEVNNWLVKGQGAMLVWH